MIFNETSLYINFKCFKDNDNPLDFKNRNTIEFNKTDLNGVKGYELVVKDNYYLEFNASDMVGKPFTIEAVCKRVDDSIHHLIAYGNDVANKARGITFWDNGELCLYKNPVVRTGILTPKDKYFHVAIVGEFDKPIKFYLNGRLVYTTTNNYSYELSDIVGADIYGVIGRKNLTEESKKNINIKMVGIHSKAFTQGEILQSFSEWLPLNPSELYIKDTEGIWNKCNF